MCVLATGVGGRICGMQGTGCGMRDDLKSGGVLVGSFVAGGPWSGLQRSGEKTRMREDAE